MAKTVQQLQSTDKDLTEVIFHERQNSAVAFEKVFSGTLSTENGRPLLAHTRHKIVKKRIQRLSSFFIKLSFQHACWGKVIPSRT